MFPNRIYKHIKWKRSFTISHIHKSSIVVESNTKYIRLTVPQKCTLISQYPSKQV